MAYVVPTRRRRRGVGDLPPCSSIDVAPGFKGPISCDPTDGQVGYPASQSQLAAIEQRINDALDSGQGAPMFPQGPQGLTQFFNDNVGTIALVIAGVFVVGMLRR